MYVMCFYSCFVYAGEELCRLQKENTEFTFELTQLQSQLDSVHREKSMLQSKQIEMERMHVQMKEAMSAEVRYLRKLNMQLVEQQMKGNHNKNIKCVLCDYQILVLMIIVVSELSKLMNSLNLQLKMLPQ